MNVGTYQWKPELIVLAALQISSSFLEDRPRNARWWAQRVAIDTDVTPREVDATVRVILQNIGYDLCAFTSEEVSGMQRAMKKGAQQLDAKRERRSTVTAGCA